MTTQVSKKTVYIFITGNLYFVRAKNCIKWRTECIMHCCKAPLAAQRFEAFSHNQSAVMGERQVPVWVGEEEMSSALSSLCKQRPVAASKVKVAAKIALKYSNDYKMAVHSIEGFIRKAAPEDKLCGIYVLDAICRQPKSQMFRERFAIRYASTIYCIWHCNEIDAPSICQQKRLCL
jgi:hypothetical protein